MVDFPRQRKLEAVSSDQEPSFGAGFESAVSDGVGNGGSDVSREKGTVNKPSQNASPRSSGGSSAEQDLAATSSFSAVKMLSDRYPSFVASHNNQRSKSESRYVLAVLLLIITLVLAAWVVWEQRYFLSDSDLVYNMGLYGGILILVTLLYALRKRVSFMKILG